MEKTDTKELLSQPEAARLLGVTAETLRDWRRRGILCGIVLSKRKVVYRRSEIERMLTAHTEGMKNAD